MSRMVVLCLLLAVVVLVLGQEEIIKCEKAKCKNPGCYCRTQENPFAEAYPALKNVSQIPQFVMLTFDDAVNVANMDFYTKDLFNGNRKNPNGQNIRGTFFVTHEYNSYPYINVLYKAGHEIASHSISHSPITDIWVNKDKNEWKDEISGMRDMLVKYAGIPAEEITGVRAPFLQTAGDVTFDVLHKEKFLYDSSMATRDYSVPPIWPYTLDFGLDQDCVIAPCPEATYFGLWEVPLVSLWKERVIVAGEEPEMMPCAMADACVPAPETAKETEDYFMDNFLRHYKGDAINPTNHAPFPVFLHEAFLKHPERKKGYLAFVDNVLKNHKDVYFVTVQEVIEFMKSPKAIDAYKAQARRSRKAATNCGGKYPHGNACTYKNLPEHMFGERIMYSCFSCPKSYPWVRNLS